jgi:hypothetical protein
MEVINSDNDDQDLDESRILDVRMASDKVLGIIRDHIISRNISIREAFNIENI